MALGRKNHLFAGSDGGGEHWAILASLIATCKMLAVDPQAYLADVLAKIVDRHPMSRLDELLPFAYVKPEPEKAVATTTTLTIQRCQIHKARNVVERLPKPLHASVRRALRQAWELDDANKAERLLRNLARRLDQEAPGVAASILEGLDEMLTVNRLGLPAKLRRSLACTNSIENMTGTVRRVCRNVKRWQNAAMALRWTAAGMLEAAKGFRRLKAYKHLPVLELRLLLINPTVSPNQLKTTLMPHIIFHGDACFAYFNKIWASPFPLQQIVRSQVRQLSVECTALCSVMHYSIIFQAEYTHRPLWRPFLRCL